MEALRIRFRRVDGVDLTRPGAFAAAKAEDLVTWRDRAKTTERDR